MKKYLSLIKTSLVNRLDYRQELLTSLIVGGIVFFGQYFFWKAVYGGAEEQLINGYNFKGILTYYLLIRIISEIVDSKAGFRLCDMIIDGTISNLLIKPLNIRTWFMADEMGRILVDVVLKLVVYITIFALVIGFPAIGYLQIMVFIFSLISSFIISFNIYFLSGCIGFFVESAGGINYAVRRLIFFLSGGLIPFTFFPEIFQNLVKFLPFKYIFDLPISILLSTSKMSNNDIVTGLMIQFVWLIVMWAFTNFLFGKLIKGNQSAGI